MKKNIEIKNATKKEKEFKEKAEEIRIKERKIFAKGIHNYLLLYLIIFLCLIKYYKSNPSITLQILLMESGEIQIYRDEYPPCATYAPLPDEVYIDDVKQDEAKSIYQLEGDFRFLNIKLIWYNPFNDASCMFYECDKISGIDLSNFDTSNLVNTDRMFSGCQLLNTINLANFDTSKVTKMYKMFYNCNTLYHLDLSTFITSKVENMADMFGLCGSLKTLKISSFDTTLVKDMTGMFEKCNYLTSLNLNNFDTSSVTSMSNLFFNCESLVSLDLTNFEFSSVSDMDKMFRGCSSLHLLKLGRLVGNPSNDRIFSSIYYNSTICTTDDESWYDILDYHNFISEINIICIGNLNIMNKCYKYNPNKFYSKYICLKCGKNFYSKNDDVLNDDTHTYCYQISDGDYLDFNENYPLPKSCYSTCKTCDIEGNETYNNCNECKENYSASELDNGYYNCFNEAELIKETTNLIKNDEIYSTNIITDKKIETEMITTSNYYLKEPTTNNQLMTSINTYMESTSPKIESELTTNININYYTTDISNNQIITNINTYLESTNPKIESELTTNIKVLKSTNEFTTNGQIVTSINTYLDSTNINNIHSTNEITTKTQIMTSMNTYINNINPETITIENYLKKNFNKLNIDRGADMKITKGNINYMMTSTKNQKNNENGKTTIINLKDCETKLKGEYKIPEQEPLYILKIDIKEEGMKIPKIEYEVFSTFNNNTLTQLNLSFCKNIPIDVLIPVPLKDDLDKHNKSSKYYNNICSKAKSKNGTDINLDDRRNEFVENNMTLCEEDCDLVDYNYTNQKAKCSCLVKISIPIIEEIKFNKTRLYNSFTDYKNFANLLVLKCYDTAFKLSNLKSNIGFYICAPIFLFYFITLLVFLSSGFPSLRKIIYKIIDAKEQQLKFEDKNKNKNKNKNISRLKASDNNYINNLRNRKKNLNINKNKKKLNKRNKNSPPKKLKQIKLKSKIKNNNPNNKRKYILSIKKNKKGNNNIFSSVNQRILNNNKNNNYLNNNSNKTMIKNNKANKLNKEYNIILKRNDLEINSLPYEEALIVDERTCIQYYLSLLRANHLLIFSFYKNDKDYNSGIIKIFLFFFFFSVHFTVNALFFIDKTIHQIYNDGGIFNFIYNIPQIILSSLISGLINFIIKYLSLSQKIIIELKQEKNIRNFIITKLKVFKIIKIKFAFFFIITFLFLMFFIYYIACFCGVYVNTQIYLIKDTVISFSLSLITPFIKNIIPSTFRICALRSKKKNNKCLYKISQWI